MAEAGLRYETQHSPGRNMRQCQVSLRSTQTTGSLFLVCSEGIENSYPLNPATVLQVLGIEGFAFEVSRRHEHQCIKVAVRVALRQCDGFPDDG